MIDQVSPMEEQILTRSDAKQVAPKIKQTEIDLPNFKAITKLAPRNTEESAAYLRRLHETDNRNYFRRCLVVQREARGIPALAPTALAAALMTPESERVYDIKDWRRGMVGYCDDPNDSNAAGHIFFIVGRTKSNHIITWSNDVKDSGAIDLVRLNFYKERWGDDTMFAATWLNGYDFLDFNKAPEPVKNFNTLGDRYADAIDQLKAIRKIKERQGANRIVRVLTRDINRMQEHLEKNAV